MGKQRPLPDPGSFANKQYLTPREAAVFLGCSVSKIEKWRQAEKLSKQQAWTREELRAAEKAAATAPPKKRGLKLDLGEPVKKKNTAGDAPAPASERKVATPPPATGKGAAPAAPPPKTGGGLSSLLRSALDPFGIDDDEKETA